MEEAVGKHDKYDLIGDQAEGARSKGLQIGETLQLAMPFFNSGAKGIGLTAQSRVGNRRCGQQYPVIFAAVCVHFLIDDGIQRYGARRKGLHAFNDSDFGTKRRLRGRFCFPESFRG